MDTSRERILKALCELVGRKDAAVFQSGENFERLLQKIGGWQQLPEITALKSGLQERIPWELQKGAVGPIPRSLISTLAANIDRKHQVGAELAVWAVESWATSLGLKIDAEPVRPQVSASQTAEVAVPVNNAEAWRVYEKNRTGIIFGSDAQGVIKVFKAWWLPAPERETAGMTAIIVKAEKSDMTGFFGSATVVRNKSPLRGQTKPAVLSPQSSSAPGNAVTAITNAAANTAQTKIVTNVTGHSAPAGAKSQPVQPKTAAPSVVSVAPVVLTGSAEELCARAKSLLPGYGNRIDVPAAMQMLQQAAKLGSIPARRMIGEIYHKGLGVKQDFATAANWFKLGADGGDAHAQFYLGTLYQCGMGVEFNLARAQEWLQRAANQGHKEAKALLIEILQA